MLAARKKAAAVYGRSSDFLYEHLSSLLIQPLAFTVDSKVFGTLSKVSS